MRSQLFSSSIRLSLLLGSIALLPATLPGQWSDDFDSYATGSAIVGQGNWIGWDQTPGIDADVSDDVAFSTPNSLRLRTNSDMVQRYQDFKGGIWVARAMTYIPAIHSGESWFILLNKYAPGGPNNWSTQVVFTGGQANSLGGTDFGGTGSLPWTAVEWVELVVEIDFDANVQVITYGGEKLDETAWQVSGANEIQAIDLYSANGSFVYFDDISIMPVPAGPRSVRSTVITGACPNPDPVLVTIRQPIPDGADPGQLVTVKEVVSGDFGAASVAPANGGVDEDVFPTPPVRGGFISAWLLLGPFVGHTGADNPGCPEMQRDFLTDGVSSELDVLPEAGQTIDTDFGGIAASTGIAGPEPLNPGGVPTWNAHYNPDDTVDFNTEYYSGDINNVMMYAFTYVNVEADIDVDLCVSSDDSVQVIIDSAEAWCNSIPRGVGAANSCLDTVALGTLAAGEHTVEVPGDRAAVCRQVSRRRIPVPRARRSRVPPRRFGFERQAPVDGRGAHLERALPRHERDQLLGCRGRR